MDIIRFFNSDHECDPKLNHTKHDYNSDNIVQRDYTTGCDYKIATMTISSKVANCELNLINIGKYMEIDDDIAGIKYTYGDVCFSKGIYTTTIYKKSKKKKESKINPILFYNQISLVVNLNNKQINVKLFGNGSLHITGCKSSKDGYNVTNIIYNKLKSISTKTQKIILSSDNNSVLLDSNDFIYNYRYQIIGFFNSETNVYMINNKEYIVYNKIQNSFVSKKKDQQNIKTICNNNGDIIGNISFYKKNIVPNVNIHTPSNPSTTHSRIELYTVIDYNCNPFVNEMNSVPEISCNINCINVTCKLPFLINRQKLYKYFIDNNYICKYNPETYSGVKLIYKYPFNIDDNDNDNNDDNEYISSSNSINGLNGLCDCTVKCICSNVTFLIFQSGNVIVSGCKSLKQVDHVLHDFNKIIQEFKMNSNVI